jgi:acyl-CoA dehydrogenase
MEVLFKNVRVPVTNILLGEGRGFEIAQGRLGPGRIHHCMRLIGLAERALELMCKRASSRVAFGKTIASQTVTQERIAEARCKIDMARLLTLKAAWMMDVGGNKFAKNEIAMIKVVAPSMACQVIDWAMQVHGGGGMSDDFPLASAYAHAQPPLQARFIVRLFFLALGRSHIGPLAVLGKHETEITGVLVQGVHVGLQQLGAEQHDHRLHLSVVAVAPARLKHARPQHLLHARNFLRVELLPIHCNVAYDQAPDDQRLH